MDRFYIDNNGHVAYGVPIQGSVDVHNLILEGDLRKAYDLASNSMKKSRMIPKRQKYHGLKISIENPAGTIRSGTDEDGHEWRSMLHFDYGYIRDTMGVDGDHVDCFIGPYPDSKKVFVIHQKNIKTGKFDEDKCMLGWKTKAAAKRDYLLNYDRSDQIMGMTKLSIKDFKKKVLATKHKPMMVKAVIRTHQRKTKTGRTITVKQHEDKRTKQVKPSKSKGGGFIKVDALPVGSIKVPGTKVSSSADIAAIFKDMKNEAREKYWVVGAKHDGTIVSVELHSMGGIGQSVVDPKVIVSVLRANKAKKYWGLHNHPSGNAMPSINDRMALNRVKNMAKRFNIEHQEDIIIHGGKDSYSTYNAQAVTSSDKKQDKDESGWVEYPISELKVVGRKKSPEGMRNKISGSEDVAKLGKWIQSTHGEGVWAVVMDSSNAIAGFYLMGDDRITQQKQKEKYAKDLVKHMMDTGSVSCVTIGTHSNTKDVSDYHRSIKTMLSDTDYKVFDAVFASEKGYFSASQGKQTGVKKSMRISI